MCFVGFAPPESVGHFDVKWGLIKSKIMIQANLKIVKEVSISREVLENIFVTAMEGGSNHWFDLPESDKEKIRATAHPSDPFSVRVFKHIFDHGRALIVADATNGEYIGALYHKFIQWRIQKLLDSPHKWALLQEIEGNGDATSSDVVFQYLCLEDVIYG